MNNIEKYQKKFIRSIGTLAFLVVINLFLLLCFRIGLKDTSNIVFLFSLLGSSIILNIVVFIFIKRKQKQESVNSSLIKKGYTFLEFSAGLAIIIGIMLSIFTNILKVQTIYGISMEPSLDSGQRVLLNIINPIPRKGEIVIAKSITTVTLHTGEQSTEISYIAKRVVAIKDDVLTIINGYLYVNNSLYTSPNGENVPISIYQWRYITSYKNTQSPTLYEQSFLIENEYTLLIGDNVSKSVDSRNFGLFSYSQIEGTLILKF